MSAHAELLALLLPPVSYDNRGSVLWGELVAEGRSLDSALAGAELVRGAVTPFFAGELLAAWERICGITPDSGAPYQQRRQDVLTKLAEVGGLSIPYFTQLAAAMGCTVTIDEPQPFRAGSSRCGDRLAPLDVIFVWRVNVIGSATRIYRFRAGSSRVGERLAYAAESVVERVFEELKPAHTQVVFTYQE